jgi:hypothetical protein
VALVVLDRLDVAANAAHAEHGVGALDAKKLLAERVGLRHDDARENEGGDFVTAPRSMC